MLPLAIVKRLLIVSSGKAAVPRSVTEPKSELLEILYAVLIAYAAEAAEATA